MLGLDYACLVQDQLYAVRYLTAKGASGTIPIIRIDGDELAAQSLMNSVKLAGCFGIQDWDETEASPY
jgi:hypothetical protein